MMLPHSRLHRSFYQGPSRHVGVLERQPNPTGSSSIYSRTILVDITAGKSGPAIEIVHPAWLQVSPAPYGSFKDWPEVEVSYTGRFRSLM